ncbi:hypothetical protein [Kribbella sp. VKM Ac-2568]|uniref:hypothetical protein n=1 Tax=Kribbella sp. VKM Ac-2568 TaxID=2512219 RepID=UPI0018EE5FE8|nr:hypothetical protein [Kribbella sp. VKM Ac-2568]
MSRWPWGRLGLVSIFKRRRIPSDGLVAEAARNPGGWVYEIDGDWVDDPNGYVPPEAIRGGWRVDEAGRLTGEFVPNKRHGRPRDDFELLTKADHWLGWLGDQPGRAVRDRIEELLVQQVEVAKVEWLKITEEPKFLTGGMPLADDPGRAQVVRTGLAVEFGLSVVQLDGRRDVLTGVFSLAVARMDEPAAREQSWLDLGETIDQIGPLLEERLLSLG